MEKTAKYYTLKGLDGIYTEYKAAQEDANRKGFKNSYPLGFESEEEARMLQSGRWEEYFASHCCRYETDADAVACVDGTWDKKNSYGAYGVCIFFKNGSVYCESAKLEDKEPGHYTITRYDGAGNLLEVAECHYEDRYAGDGTNDKHHGYVTASNQIAGEVEGAMRVLDICFRREKLNKIDLAFDCDRVRARYIHREQQINSNVEAHYKKFCDDLEKECQEQGVQVEVEFKKINSHAQRQYLITDKLYLCAVYNDIVDALAKAETEANPIKASLNFNLTRALPGCGIQSFSLAGTGTIPQRRKYARALFEQAAERIRPVFR